MKRAFSLIELMIVIVIIGVVYTLVIIKLDKTKENESLASLSTLKAYLKSFSPEHQEVELLCQDSCDECFIYVDGKKQNVVESFFDDSILLYTYRYNEGAEQKSSNSCFDFKLDANGISDQLMIVYGGYVYDYTPYFKDVKIYDSLEAAVDAKDKLVEEVLR
ncbi:prepilin-type N-terminal cleavage/methylation domain-containing protein [Sulfurimonas sp.]